MDCAATCEGGLVDDCAGTCDGSAIWDCAGFCDGSATMDCAGTCEGSAAEDCAGTCNGSAIEDCAGTCNGSATVDCAGICNGSAAVDQCGVCGGNNSCLVVTVDGCPQRGTAHDPQDWPTDGSAKASVRCCSSAGTCRSKDASNTCLPKAATFAKAQEACASNGWFLCSAEQVDSGICCTTGCMYDNNRVWTSTFAVSTDLTPPNITCPADLELNAESCSGSQVTWNDADFTVADDINADMSDISIICSRVSNTMFAFGTTIVTCHATDLAGNTSADDCQFSVTVLGCGDGQVTSGEECEPPGKVWAADELGTGTLASRCDSLCNRHYCGDGIVDNDLGEECDDGNLTPEDGCTNCMRDLLCEDLIWDTECHTCRNYYNVGEISRVPDGEACQVTSENVCYDGVCSTPPGQCVDDENWVNSDGIGCDWYNIFDSIGVNICLMEPSHSEDGVPATTACCVCRKAVGWTCDPYFYGANSRCDCGCGVPDPNCGVIDQDWEGDINPSISCHSDEMCIGGVCSPTPSGLCPGGVHIPEGACDCDGNVIPPGACDCSGNVMLECGCALDLPVVTFDCAGNVMDECGVCGGDGSLCAATALCNSGTVIKVAGNFFKVEGVGVCAGKVYDYHDGDYATINGVTYIINGSDADREERGGAGEGINEFDIYTMDQNGAKDRPPYTPGLGIMGATVSFERQ